MKKSVYIETTIIGYLAARPSRDLITAANQEMTHRWWNDQRDKFRLYTSEAVVAECSAGDKNEAKKRLELLAGIHLLDVTEEDGNFARGLMKAARLPKKAKVDALHIAIAAANGMHYLLTWNCKHIANATLRPAIEGFCRDGGFDPPVICTPQELLGE